MQAASVNLQNEPILAYVNEVLEESIAKSRKLSHELSPSFLYHGIAYVYILFMFHVVSGSHFLVSNLGEYAVSATGRITSLFGVIVFSAALVIGIHGMHVLLQDLLKEKIETGRELEERNALYTPPIIGDTTRARVDQDAFCGKL